MIRIAKTKAPGRVFHFPPVEGRDIDTILENIDTDAELDDGRKFEVRDMWISTAEVIARRDGDFDSGRIRIWLDEHDKQHIHGPQAGAAIGMMLARGRIEKVEGKTARGASNRIIWVYRFIDGSI